MSNNVTVLSVPFTPVTDQIFHVASNEKINDFFVVDSERTKESVTNKRRFFYIFFTNKNAGGINAILTLFFQSKTNKDFNKLRGKFQVCFRLNFLELLGKN